MTRRNTSDLPEIMTPREAATTGIATARTFIRWAESGKIRAIRLPNGRFRFRRADIEALLLPTTPSAPSVLSADLVSDSSSVDESFDQPLPGFEEV